MNEDKQKLSFRLNDKLIDLFNSGFDKRAAYWEEHKSEIPDITASPYIITNCANKNMAIAFGLNLIPGPFGMAAVIPEIILIMRNQINMVYDLAVAYQQDKKVDKSIMLSIFLSAFGSGAMGLAVMQGSKVILKRVSLRVMQRLVTLLAGKVTQQVLKRILAKYVPVGGALIISAWTRYTTKIVGEKSIEFFSKKIEISDEDLELSDV